MGKVRGEENGENRTDAENIIILVPVDEMRRHGKIVGNSFNSLSWEDSWIITSHLTVAITRSEWQLSLCGTRTPIQLT